jgi:ferredoxin-NADP reductase/predicted pyridoxine 5'-phosphate oxidase superfamily flavin-nucleotide-binding protein
MVSRIPVSRHVAWHEGEVAIQRRAGVATEMDRIAQYVNVNVLVAQHRTFFANLAFVLVGTVDHAGNSWATVLTGFPGFLHSPDPSTLRVSISANPSDPAQDGMKDGQAIGMLGIDLNTRRRNRANGGIRRESERTFDIDVTQSYGNCPQYIQMRDFAFARDPSLPCEGRYQVLDALTDHAAAMIANADTFFISSYIDRKDGPRQVDVSHKAGRPGFVKVENDGLLTIPDFVGNMYFNTLGNILINPKCGLVFIDFATGDMLQLTGDGEVVFDAIELAAFRGAQRLLRFKPRQIVFRPDALAVRWKTHAAGASPNAQMTGSWSDVEAKLKLVHQSSWRPFKVCRIVDETPLIRSLFLMPNDGAGLVLHRAGQHLSVKLMARDSLQPSISNYSVSSAPSDGIYRISIKREGSLSQLMHSLRVGDVIQTGQPAGSFVMDTSSSRLAVLIAGGIGVTPLLSMLRHTVTDGIRTKRMRPIWLVYAAHSKEEQAFAREISSLASAGSEAVRITRVLSDVSTANEADYDFEGRISIELLRSLLPSLQESEPREDCDYFICGPTSFTQDLYDGLRISGVADTCIYAETFGPSSLARLRDIGIPEAVLPERAQHAVEVTFTVSAKTVRWTPESGSLLELAEAHGLAPSYNCRVGTCGTCSARVLSGAVTYLDAPLSSPMKEHALICCAVPAESAEQDGLRLEL